MEQRGRRTAKQIIGALEIWGGGAGLVAVLSNAPALATSGEGIVVLVCGTLFFSASVGAGVLLGLKREWGSEVSILLQALQIPSIGGKVTYHLYSGAAAFLNFRGPDAAIQFNVASGIELGYTANDALSLFGFNVLAAALFVYLVFAPEDDVVGWRSRSSSTTARTETLAD